MSRLMKVSLIAPLLITFALTFLIMLFFPPQLLPDKEARETFVGIISVGILLILNVMTFFVGTLYLMFLERKKLVSATTIIGGGIMFGALAGVLFSVFLRYEMGAFMLIVVVTFSMIGSTLSSSIWHYGLRPLPESKQGPPTEPTE